jgi:serine/threonine-protein kinase
MPIAQGGMATVWAARQRGSRGFSKTVAVKTILPNLSDDPQFEQMFLDEASIASKIHHPNVAEIYDLGEQDEVLYLVMEWVDGESFSTLSKTARKNGSDIPLRVGLKIVAQAAAGLHAAHELRDDDDRLIQLVHRDVSPQNILVGSTGAAKIVDFGVAKALGRAGETSAGQLKGKVPFMSPEQAKGGQVDRRTDIFALGIMLYRIATGAHPFLDEDDIKTLRNIITRPAMPPRVKNPACPVALEKIILRALQKDPEKRYQTAAELETDLEGAMAASGGLVPIDEVATFVKATLGERDRKRKAALRDAALKIDEQGADPRHSNPALSSPESVSGVMLTKMETPPGERSGAATINDVTAPHGRASQAPVSGDAPHSATNPSAGVPGSVGPADPRLVSSPTLVAMAASQSGAKSSSKKLVVVGIGVALALGIGAVGVMSLGSKTTEPPAKAAATGAPAALTAAAKVETPAAVTTATPSDTSGTKLSLDDMPNADDDAKTDGTKPVRSGRGGVRTAATASAKPTATAAATAPPVATATTKPTATANNPNVPAVTDPGF